MNNKDVIKTLKEPGITRLTIEAIQELIALGFMSDSDEFYKHYKKIIPLLRNQDYIITIKVPYKESPFLIITEDCFNKLKLAVKNIENFEEAVSDNEIDNYFSLLF